MSQERTVAKFLERVIRSETPAQRVVLVLIGAKGTQGSALFTLPVPEPRRFAEDDAIDAVVGEVLQTAQQDANGWGGVNRYMLIATYADGSTSRSSVFRVSSTELSEDDSAGSEPATATGALAQSMRLTEIFARQLTTLASSVAHHQAETIARQAETIAGNDRRAVRQLELTEELLSNNHQRAIEMKREETKANFKAKAAEKFLPLVQVAGARLLTNGKIPPIVGQDVLASFLKGIRPEQMARIWEVLEPEQAAKLIELTKHLDLGDEPAAQKGEPRERHEDDRPGTGFH